MSRRRTQALHRGDPVCRSPRGVDRASGDQRKSVEHFLLSLALDRYARLHCYLMCNDRRYLRSATDRLLTEAAKLGCNHPLARMVLATRLVNDVAAVREIVSKRSAKTQRLLREATDFHFSLWATHVDDPTDAQLMAMH